MKSKPVRYNGQVYESIAKLISEALSNGGKISIVIRADKAYTKSVLEYRLYSDETTFISLTKYQAKRWLSSFQLEMEQKYNKVKDLLYKYHNFGDRIDKNKILVKLCENEPIYKLLQDIIVNLKTITYN